MTGQKKDITIRGVVVAQDWDSDNCPTEVSIQTTDGREYFVDEEDAGEELLDLEGAEVEITGKIDDRDPDYPSLSVRDYEILNDPFSDDDEEEEEGEDDWVEDEDEDEDDEDDEDWDEDEDDWDEDEDDEDWDEDEEEEEED